MSLTKRHGIYYAQRSVPADLRHIIGKSNFRQSTGCRDKINANAEAAPWLKEWDRLIKLAYNEPNAVLEEIAILKARSAIEAEAGDIDEWGYTPAEATLEGAYQDAHWLESLPPSEAAKYRDVMFGKGVPFPTFMQRFLDEHYTKHKPRLEARRYILDATVFVPTLESLSVTNAKSWVAAEARKPANERRATKTMHKAASYVTQYIRWMQDTQLLSSDIINPFHGLTYPKNLKPPEQYAPFTIDEITTLRKGATSNNDMELLAFIDIARYTGMRIAEVGALSHKSIEEIDGTLCFRVKLDAKNATSAARLVPIAAPLHQLIDLHTFDLSRRENAVGKRFGRLKKQVLSDGSSRIKCFHSIRKTVVTTLEQAGISEGIAADLIGHKKKTITYGVYSGGSALGQLITAIDALVAAMPTPSAPPSNVIRLHG